MHRMYIDYTQLTGMSFIYIYVYKMIWDLTAALLCPHKGSAIQSFDSYFGDRWTSCWINSRTAIGEFMVSNPNVRRKWMLLPVQMLTSKTKISYDLFICLYISLLLPLWSYRPFCRSSKCFEIWKTLSCRISRGLAPFRCDRFPKYHNRLPGFLCGSRGGLWCCLIQTTSFSEVIWCGK